MAVKLRCVVVLGYFVLGPNYYLLPVGGGLFPTREAARDRAREIAEADDWHIEPVFK